PGRRRAFLLRRSRPAWVARRAPRRRPPGRQLSPTPSTFHPALRSGSLVDREAADLDLADLEPPDLGPSPSQAADAEPADCEAADRGSTHRERADRLGAGGGRRPGLVAEDGGSGALAHRRNRSAASLPGLATLLVLIHASWERP